MNTILNGSPQSLNRGIQDVSPATPTILPEDLPTHLPFTFCYTEKGPVDPQLVVGDSRDSIFGVNSFDLRQKWANHATVFSNGFNAQANSQMLKRIQPVDAPGPANLRLYLDLLPTQVQDYVRNNDGSIQINPTTGAPVPTANKIAGFLAKWVLGNVDVVDGSSTFGIATQNPGDQSDSSVSPAVQSTRYPIMDLAVSSFGSWGNNQALRLWAPTTQSSTPLDQRLVSDQMVYPFFMAVTSRPDSLTTPKVAATLGGAQMVPVVFKPGTIDRNYDNQLYIGDAFLQQYQSLDVPGTPPTFGQFGQVHVYDANVKAVLDLVYPVEAAVANNAFSDFTGEPGEEYRFNFISGQTSGGVPYHTFQIVTGADNSARLTDSSNLFASAGGDGTMSDALFADLVTAELIRYGDENDSIQDSATYPQSIFWDSGFPLTTKNAMAEVISVRKDLFVAIGVHDNAGPILTDDQERSSATSLLAKLQNYPESSFYGTPAARAIIVGGSGVVLNSQYTGRVPCTYELAMKSAAYMGASNGKWKPGKAFDLSPLNQIDYMRDISIPFRPATARNLDWDAGLIWPMAYSRSRSYFPQMQTIYPDDTSVLNNFLTTMACVQLEKVGEQAHRDTTGVSGLTTDQLCDRVNTLIKNAVKDVFDGRYVITPQTTISVDDKQRNYSWTTVIQIFSPMMETVQTLTIQTNNINTLNTTQGA